MDDWHLYSLVVCLIFYGERSFCFCPIRVTLLTRTPHASDPYGSRGRGIRLIFSLWMGYAIFTTCPLPLLIIFPRQMTRYSKSGVSGKAMPALYWCS